jgi:type I restriction enzyme S subunit
LETQVHGATMKHITKKNFDAFPVNLPPLETQQKIAAILDAADTLRQKDKALLAKYDELTQALFLDMFGDPVSNPKGWDLRSFEAMVKFDTKMTKDFDTYGDLLHVGIGNIQKNTGKIIECLTANDEGLTSGKYLFDKRHIIYSKIRPNLNKVALPDFTGLCSADSYPLLPIEGVSNRIFIANILRSECFLDFILQHSTRTNIPKANRTQMKLFVGICPPFELQTQFAERVTIIEQQKAIAQASLEKSEELFNSLLQKAFKGELV